MLAASREDPSDDAEADEPEHHEQLVAVFLDHSIQELGHARQVLNGMFHEWPSNFSENPF
jgi:hypothetical protein